MTGQLIIHTILGLLLLLIPAGVLYLWDKKQLTTFGIGIVRMIVQLLVLCLMFVGLFSLNNIWLSLLWLVLMAFYSSAIILWRIKASVKRFLLPVGIAQLAGTLISGFYLLWAVLPVPSGKFVYWMIPVMALLLGHSTTMLIRGLNTYLTALKADEQQYEFQRGNGKAHLGAVMPFVRRAMQAVMAPTTANLSHTALFSIPMALGGMLLGGLAPLEAFVVMVSMTAGCVAASVIALLVSLWLCDGKLFDKLGKLTLSLAFLMTSIACQGQQPVTKYEVPAKLKDRPEQILVRTGYTTSYNRDTKNPNWVAWHLTREHTKGQNQRKQMVFTEDEDVKAPRATNNDYFNSRFDRGHMCPAGDNKWDRKAMEESFLFTNICPQNHGLNKYEWNDLEIKCREWAREYGAIDIVCGPVYDAENLRTIGRNKVHVPVAFFKVILCRKGTPKAIGFLFRNEGKKQQMQDAVRSVDEIEALTGIDFFPALDDATERRIEARARLNDW